MLKVCILGEDESNELAISRHIKSFDDGIPASIDRASR